MFVLGLIVNGRSAPCMPLQIARPSIICLTPMQLCGYKTIKPRGSGLFSDKGKEEGAQVSSGLLAPQEKVG
jgi:hypothetical protein